jgi:hypothetical protein
MDVFRTCTSAHFLSADHLHSNQLFPKPETDKKAVVSVLDHSAEEKKNPNGKTKI